MPLLPLILFILVAAIPVALCVPRLPKKLRGCILALPAALAFALLAGPVAQQVLEAGSLRFSAAWILQLQIDFALNLNGMGLLLALLVTGIGSCIMLYASGYMGDHPQANRLFAFLYAFMLAMAGLAMADHLIVFFIFWELTSVTSYLLIGFNHQDADSRRSALQALLITGMGGVALLAGSILLANAGGSWYLSELVEQQATILAHANYPGILGLILLAAFTKSAQFPFHFWLPNAMAAPTPVSAYLHSATMVKAGIFLLLTMLPIIGGSRAWFITLALAGGITLLLGGLFGLKQDDLKKILAGSTLAVLGLLTLLIGIGSDKAVLAALLFLVGHAFYKAALFMTAGAIDHETGTRDTRILSGLRKLMPWTAAAAILAALSKMGLPPFFGFIGKEYAYKASLYSEVGGLLTTVLVLGNAMLFALAIRSGIVPFINKPNTDALPKPRPHEAPISMLIGPLLLATIGILVGLAPQLIQPLIDSAHQSIAGTGELSAVKLWTGINLPLILSIVTVVSGFLVLKIRQPINRGIQKLSLPDADEVYDKVLAQILLFANWQTRLLQSGYLRNYLIIIISTTAGLITLKLLKFNDYPLYDGVEGLSAFSAVISVIMLFAIGLAVFTKSRLTALIALGVIGFGVASIFAIYSAPDLAITQISVETLSVVLFAWVVYKLPVFQEFSSKRTIRFDMILSATMGILTTILLLKSEALDMGNSISHQLSEWSYPLANGANIVNVILVDFRALDTLGEIVVLSIAAVGVWALIDSQRQKPTKK